MIRIQMKSQKSISIVLRLPYYTLCNLVFRGSSVFWPFGKVTFTYVARGIKELKAPRSSKPEAGLLLKDTFRSDENDTGYFL